MHRLGGRAFLRGLDVAVARAASPRLAVRSLRYSSPLWADHEMAVPNMGDSITEGQIVTWEKSVGDYVFADDTIAVVETDKVSVDIKATASGAVKVLHGEEGDVVEVGAPFAVIDTAVEAPAAAPAAAAEPTVPGSGSEPVAPLAQPAAAAPVPSAERVPLISFRHGKRETPAETPASELPEAAALGVSILDPMPGGTYHVYELPEFYGRLPAFTEEEIERINLGESM